MEDEKPEHPRRLRSKAIALALLAVCAAWPVGIAVLRVVTARTVPVVNIRWSSRFTDQQRATAEHDLSLVLNEPKEPGTASYFLLDSDTANLRRIVTSPLVEDTAFISRSAFVLEHAPLARTWIGDRWTVLREPALLYLSLFGCLVSSGVLLSARFPRTSVGVWSVRVLTCAAGIGLSLYYGRYGYEPLDQSIVFDGAWRLLSGQIPGRDFFAADGLVPIVMQALVFKALGVTWFAYCLHAALVNGLFGVVVLELLLACGAPLLLAGTYGLISCIYFYPPFGVPYPDQHAFFFSLCLVYATVRATWPAEHEGRHRRWWVAIPILGILAMFSKPLPSLFVVAAVIVWMVVLTVRRGPRPLAIVVGTTMASVVVLLAAVLLLRIRVADTVYYTYAIPSGVMASRLRDLRIPRNILAHYAEGTRFGCLGPDCGTPVLDLVQVTGLAILGAWFVPVLRRSRTALIRATGLWLLAECLVAITLLFVFLTNNEQVNGLALEPAAIGLAHAAALVWARLAESTDRRAVLRAAIYVPFLWVAADDAARFNHEANALRATHNQHWIAGPNMREVPPPLDFMRLNEAWDPTDIVDVLPALQRLPGNFVLIGDSSVLYGASGKPSISPVLWMHVGLTLPPPGSPEFLKVERAFQDRMTQHHVQFVVLEDETHQTCPGCPWDGLSLDAFPHIKAAAEGCESTPHGRFRVISLCR